MPKAPYLNKSLTSRHILNVDMSKKSMVNIFKNTSPHKISDEN